MADPICLEKKGCARRCLGCKKSECKDMMYVVTAITILHVYHALHKRIIRDNADVAIVAHAIIVKNRIVSKLKLKEVEE